MYCFAKCIALPMPNKFIHSIMFFALLLSSGICSLQHFHMFIPRLLQHAERWRRLRDAGAGEYCISPSSIARVGAKILLGHIQLWKNDAQLQDRWCVGNVDECKVGTK